MNNKTKTLLRFLLVATIVAGCSWVAKAGFGFFGGGNDSLTNLSGESFNLGPESEEQSAEGTTANDVFGFPDVGTDSLDVGTGDSTSDGSSAGESDGGLGGGGSGSTGELGNEGSQGTTDADFHPPYHTHTVNYYDQHVPAEEVYAPFHPVSVYDKNKKKNEEGEGDVEK